MSKGDIRSTGGEKEKMETSTVHFEVDKKGETKKKKKKNTELKIK